MGRNNCRCTIWRIFSDLAEQENSQQVPFLRGLGERIYDAAPSTFKSVYWRLRDNIGDQFRIQFISDRFDVPWELMCPYREGSPGDILCLGHPVARWLSRYEGRMTPHITRGRIVSVSPIYPPEGELAPLPAAQEESAALVQTLGAHRLEPATRAAFMNEISRSKDERIRSTDRVQTPELRLGRIGAGSV